MDLVYLGWLRIMIENLRPTWAAWDNTEYWCEIIQSFASFLYTAINECAIYNDLCLGKITKCRSWLFSEYTSNLASSGAVLPKTHGLDL